MLVVIPVGTCWGWETNDVRNPWNMSWCAIKMHMQFWQHVAAIPSGCRIMSPATLAIQIDKNLIQALYLQKNEVNPYKLKVSLSLRDCFKPSISLPSILFFFFFTEASDSWNFRASQLRQESTNPTTGRFLWMNKNKAFQDTVFQWDHIPKNICQCQLKNIETKLKQFKVLISGIFLMFLCGFPMLGFGHVLVVAPILRHRISKKNPFSVKDF